MKKFATIIAIFIGVNLMGQPLGWLYNQPIIVTNPNATAGVNYQLRITVNTQSIIAASKMKPDGSDIRFGGTCSSGTFFNYWIEGGINTATTAIWVKIPLIAANSSTTIFMYYGNPGASAFSSIPSTFRGPNSATDSVFGGTSGGLSQCQRGFRFAPTQPVLVTDFGKNEPSGTTRYVTLFNYGTQAILSQTQVSGPSATYTYGPIGQPLWLTTGTQYVLQIYGLVTDGYYFGTSSQIGLGLTYYDMQYSNGGNQNTFPTSALANYHYGYGDFLYYLTNTLVVTPTYVYGNAYGILGGPANICTGTSATITANAAGTYSWNTGSTASVIVVTPSVTTNYSITEIGGIGCAVTVVTVSAGLPTISVVASPSTVCAGKNVVLTASGASTYTWSNGVPNGGAYAPVVSGTYSVTGVNVCGSSTTAISVSVVPLPNVTASINNPTVCNGGQVIVNAAGNATAYVWSNGILNNVAFAPAATANYTVTGTSVDGCTATAVTGVTVLVTPTITPIATPTAICAGGTATLSAAGASGYTWTPGSNLTAATVTVSPPAPTTFTLIRTNGTCSGTTTLSLMVNPLPLVNASATPSQICSGTGINLLVFGAITYTWLPGGFTISNFTVYPNVSTTYSVVGSNGNCTTSVIVPVVVNPSPVISISSSTNTICEGQNVTLTANGNGALTYTWQPMNTNNASIVTSPATTTIITLAATNASNCTSSVGQLVIVNPVPDMSLTSSLPFVCANQSALLSVVNPSTMVVYGWSTGAFGSSIQPNPGITTNYSVTGTNTITGCQNTNSITLAVYIATFVVTSPTAICKGDVATMTASGPATSYSWSVNGGKVASSVTVAPVINTTYYVTGTNGSCSNTQSVSIIVNQIPNVIAIAAKTQICRFEVSMITASGATSYSWNTGASTPTISFTLSLTTTYTLTGTDLNGCSKTTTVTQFVATCIGIEELEVNGNIGLNVYPNPNNGSFIVSSDADIILSIVNELGQVVNTARLSDENKKEITVSSLPAGIYFIKGEANGIKINKKIIVEK